MIVLENVTFAYPGQEPVFEELNWHVESGEAWAVLGPSGCGKTTLLYLLAGLRQPLLGRILVGGRRLAGPRPNTGLILQDYGLLPWATALKNVSLGLDIRRFYGIDGKHTPEDDDPGEHQQRVSYWLERLRLSEHQDKYPVQLSGGQRQRVAIARTLALNPDLLLMDEPFSSLDAPTRESLQDLSFELSREQQLTTVIVTHSIEEAAILGKKILVLNLPPYRHPAVIDNPGAGSSSFRQSTEYYEMCLTLRQSLDEQE